MILVEQIKSAPVGAFTKSEIEPIVGDLSQALSQQRVYKIQNLGKDRVVINELFKFNCPGKDRVNQLERCGYRNIILTPDVGTDNLLVVYDTDHKVAE